MSLSGRAGSMRPRAEGLMSRLAAAVRPARPWLRINASPRAARFLVAAGARPGCMDLEAMLLSGAGLPGAGLSRAYPREIDPAGMGQSRADLTGAHLAEADL